MEYARSDCILREILEERKSLTGFLDAIFGFMSRNTDFYHIQKTKNDKMGFPRGVKEQIIMSCMQKYELPYIEPKLTRDLIVDDGPVLVAEEVEIVTEESEKPNECNKVHEIAYQNEIKLVEKSKNVECSKVTTKFNESDYRNGSLLEKYCWSQTLEYVEINVLLPKEVKKAEHIKVDLKPNHITVKTLLPKEEILINGATWDKYKLHDTLWSITDGKLIISFDKLKECWWDKLFVDEAAIDIKTLDTERPIDDYTQETQNAIKKLLIQQNHQNQDF